jgi:ABC-type antimicrobial peptide transport system permease subunit
MLSFVLRRASWTILLLVIVNFASFSYAHYGRYAQLAKNPFFAARSQERGMRGGPHGGIRPPVDAFP